MQKRCSPQLFETISPTAIRLCEVNHHAAQPNRRPVCMNGIPLNSHNKFFPPFPNLNRSFAPTNSSVAFWSPEATKSGSNCGGRAKTAPVIYAVDDMPCLTELYALVLNKSGYVVRSFHDRRAALASLEVAETKPALLITDLHNATMRIEPFLRECVSLHPALRILMATGFGYHRAWCFAVKPDRFLPKPFTPEELRHAVEDMLAVQPDHFGRIVTELPE